MADHDGGYKLLFSHARMVEDLIRGFVREDWVEELDFSSLEKLPTSFINTKGGERRDGDVLWRLRWGTGRGCTSTSCWSCSRRWTATWRCGC